VVTVEVMTVSSATTWLRFRFGVVIALAEFNSAMAVVTLLVVYKLVDPVARVRGNQQETAGSRDETDVNCGQN
jgi:high-affinity Fe2+/Pb2+ permease